MDRSIAKFARAAATAALVVACGLAIAVTKPYLRVELVKTGDRPVTTKAIWVAWACGGEERITEVEVSGAIADGPLSIRVLKGRPNPEDSSAAVPGNVFTITGYRYNKRSTNLITGSFKDEASPVFDVIGWRVESPGGKLIPGEGFAPIPKTYSLTANAHGKGRQAEFVGIDGGSC